MLLCSVNRRDDVRFVESQITCASNGSQWTTTTEPNECEVYSAESVTQMLVGLNGIGRSF